MNKKKKIKKNFDKCDTRVDFGMELFEIAYPGCRDRDLRISKNTEWKMRSGKSRNSGDRKHFNILKSKKKAKNSIKPLSSWESKNFIF